MTLTASADKWTTFTVRLSELTHAPTLARIDLAVARPTRCPTSTGSSSTTSRSSTEAGVDRTVAAAALCRAVLLGRAVVTVTAAGAGLLIVAHPERVVAVLALVVVSTALEVAALTRWLVEVIAPAQRRRVRQPQDHRARPLCQIHTGRSHNILTHTLRVCLARVMDPGTVMPIRIFTRPTWPALTRRRRRRRTFARRRHLGRILKGTRTLDGRRPKCVAAILPCGTVLSRGRCRRCSSPLETASMTSTVSLAQPVAD
jgi:hypothetical protein